MDVNVLTNFFRVKIIYVSIGKTGNSVEVVFFLLDFILFIIGIDVTIFTDSNSISRTNFVNFIVLVTVSKDYGPKTIVSVIIVNDFTFDSDRFYFIVEENV